jgi:uncharacterized membrane protein YdjX (TVP38/TMEM64 family)
MSISPKEQSHLLEHLKRWGPLALFVVALVAVYASGLNRYVSPAFLKARHDEMKAFVDAHFWLSLLAFTVCFALLTAVAVPGAVFAQLLGGFLFGAWLGGASIALAATAGALVIYSVTRTAFGESLRRRLHTDKGALSRLQKGLDQHSFWFLLAVRLAPVVPFVLVNIASGLARIPMRRYVLATFIGTFPTNFVYAWIGAGLDRIFAEGRELDMGLLLDWRVMAPLSGLAFLSLLPVGARIVWERFGGRRPI